MYDVRRLVLLRDLAERGTMTAVSEQHGITTSAVSQQLRILEEEVGAALTRRDGRVLRLTGAGRVLVDHTARILAALEEAESAVAATADTIAGVLTIACFQTAMSELALPVAAKLGNEHPDLRVRLVEAMPVDSVPAVRQQEVDLAITYTYSFGAADLPSGMTTDYLFSDPLVLLAPSAWRERVTVGGLAALADADWIAAQDGAPSISSVMFSCRQAGFTPRIVHRSSSFAMMSEMVDGGFGATIVPQISVPDRYRHLIAAPIVDGARRLGVTYRQASIERPAVAAAIRAFRQRVQPVGLAS
ncbi:LysR family transcriptional regulator [Rhodococcoides yunnanense]|uniref:LysR family transcriptional regulator n=1 Tax=Rhodococcoides yunnanense TaxID=278209 RepID=UPI00093510D4|nr:LysR family transcriptional regulator [Rhodococcus yunnanensis]